MSPRPATGTTDHNNKSEEDTMLTHSYTPNRIDYSILYDWLATRPGQQVTHGDLLDHLSGLGLDGEFQYFRKALNYISRPVTTASLRKRLKVRGLVLSPKRGTYVYDPKASVHHYSTSDVTRVVSRVVNENPGVPFRIANARFNEPSIVVYNRPSDIDTDTDHRPAVAPPVEHPAFPLAEVLADADGTVVLRHEDGTVIVATVTARTVTTVS